MEIWQNRVYYKKKPNDGSCFSMFVTIESAIVHVFNQADGYPIFSDIPIALDAEFET